MIYTAPKEEEKKVKKDDVKVVTDVQNTKSDKAIKQVDKEHKIRMKVARAGVEEKNIIDGKRQRKPNGIYLSASAYQGYNTRISIYYYI